MHSELDVDRVLEAVTEATKKWKTTGDDFWIKAEGLLVRSYCVFMV